MYSIEGQSSYLGIDLGTTVIKGVAINNKGKILADSFIDNETQNPHTNWVEQDPQIWWQKTLQIIETLSYKISPETVRGIGLSGQMHGLVMYDQHKNPTRDAIIWLDKRSEEQVEQIKKSIGETKIYRITGNPVFTGLLMPSLLWVMENELEIYDATEVISSPKDYLAAMLTGRVSTEPTDALATGGYDYQRDNWSEEIVGELGLRKEIFPKVNPTTKPYGEVTKEVFKLSRIPENTPVFGGSDQSMTALGIGLIKEQQAVIAISTGGQFLVVAQKGIVDEKRRLHTLNHVNPDVGLYMAATLSAGLSLRWFKNEFCGLPKMDYNGFLKGIESIPIGCDNLIFLPFLNGERTPYFNPNLRGGFFGLNQKHSKLHLARAIMEGVAFSMKQCLKVFEELNIPIGEIILSGGGSKSSVWCQIITDVIGIPTRTTNITDHSPYGAALLAKFAQEGLEKLPDFYRRKVQTIAHFEPSAKNRSKYEDNYNKYSGLAEYLNEQSLSS